jgi:hypothetical protein
VLAAEAAKFKTSTEMLAQQQLEHQQFVADIIPYTEDYARVEQELLITKQENEQMKTLLADPTALGDYYSNLIAEINKQNIQEQPRMQESQSQPQPQYQPTNPNPSSSQSESQSTLVPMGRDQFYSYVDPIELAKRQAEYQMTRISYPTQSTDGKTRIEDIHPSQRYLVMDRLEKEKVFGKNWK